MPANTIDMPTANVINNFFFSTNPEGQQFRVRSSLGPAMTASLLAFNIPSSMWTFIWRCIQQESMYEQEEWESVLVGCGVPDDFIPYMLKIMDAEAMLYWSTV
jgi:hypothetical protein